MTWAVILCRHEKIHHSCLEGFETKQIFLQMSSLKKHFESLSSCICKSGTQSTWAPPATPSSASPRYLLQVPAGWAASWGKASTSLPLWNAVKCWRAFLRLNHSSTGCARGCLLEQLTAAYFPPVFQTHLTPGVKAQLPQVNSCDKLFLETKQGQLSHQGQGNVCIYFVVNQTVPVCKVILKPGEELSVVNTVIVSPLCILVFPWVFFCQEEK